MRVPKQNEARTVRSRRAVRSSRELQSSEGLVEQRAMGQETLATFDFTDLSRWQGELARELIDTDPERQAA